MVTKKPVVTHQVERRTDISELSITDLWNASRKTISDLEERVKEVYSQSDIRKVIASGPDEQLKKLQISAEKMLSAILIRDGSFASSHHVEHHLWMAFYKEIEGALSWFRSKSSPVHADRPLRNKARERLFRLLKVARKCLRQLVLTLVSKVEESTKAAEHSDPSVAHSLREDIGKRRRSVHSLLISLGDLARYEQTYCRPKKDWAPATLLYERALQMFPPSGKAHNQLAVLASYGRKPNYFMALYQYCFSLAVAKPFPARQNVLSPISKNRKQAVKIMGRSGSTSSHAEPKGDFFCLFVRCIGIFFTATDVGILGDVIGACTRYFEAALRPSSSSLQELELVRCMGLCIFAVCNSLTPLGSQHHASDKNAASSSSSSAAITIPAVMSQLTSRALELFMRLLAALLRTYYNALQRRDAASADHLLAAIGTAARWLRSQPRILTASPRHIVRDLIRKPLVRLLNAVKSPAVAALARHAMLITHGTPIDWVSPKSKLLAEDMELTGFLLIPSLTLEEPSTSSYSTILAAAGVQVQQTPKSTVQVFVAPANKEKVQARKRDEQRAARKSDIRKARLVQFALEAALPSALVFARGKVNTDPTAADFAIPSFAEHDEHDDLASRAALATDVGTHAESCEDRDSNDTVNITGMLCPGCSIPLERGAKECQFCPFVVEAPVEEFEDELEEQLTKSLTLTPAPPAYPPPDVAEGDHLDTEVAEDDLLASEVAGGDDIALAPGERYSSASGLHNFQRSQFYARRGIPMPTALDNEPNSELPAGIAGDTKQHRQPGVLFASPGAAQINSPAPPPTPPPKCAVIAKSALRLSAAATMTKTDTKSLVVLDAPNIAMRHGLNKKFSTYGIELALRFWEDRGHRTIGFLPDYYVNDRSVAAKRSMKRTGIGTVRAASLPDDTIRLKQMVAEGRVVLTPPQDYDDSYCIQYAKRYGGVIVTNDLYRDHVDKYKGDRRQLRQWLKTHCISYTFVLDDFLPNPDFKFPK